MKISLFYLNKHNLILSMIKTGTYIQEQVNFSFLCVVCVKTTDFFYHTVKWLSWSPCILYIIYIIQIQPHPDPDEAVLHSDYKCKQGSIFY
jgi:hypothetical protein